MRGFVRAVRSLRFKRRDRTAQKADACHLGLMKACLDDKFSSKPQQYFLKKRWRLLGHIIYTAPTAKINEPPDIELDEDILERIDFLACLFSKRRIE
jgi:hypothetical protein